MILGLFGFDMGKSTELQTEWAKQGILVAWMAVPAILLIICAASLKFYLLAGREWDEIKREIEEKHGLPAEIEEPAETVPEE